jgi:hypothetical protein
MGLDSALKWFIEGFAERSKITANLELPTNWERLSQDYEIPVSDCTGVSDEHPSPFRKLDRIGEAAAFFDRNHTGSQRRG